MLAALGVTNSLILWLAGFVGAIAFVVLALRANLRKFLPIVLTASAGATMLMAAGLLLFGQPVEQITWSNLWVPTGGLFAILIWAVLTGVGILIQAATNQRSLEVDLAQYQV